MENEMNTPKEYFDYITSKKQIATSEFLNDVYDKSLILLSKYKKTKQVEGMKKLIFILRTLEKELKAVDLGFSTYVDREDIEEYIEDVEKNVVKIIEIGRYEREIPDEIVEKIKICDDNDIFDDYYVVFTDYKGKVEKQIEKERRDKDPILFGIFCDKINNNNLSDRFYFIGDWEDEYCDLTLDKMVTRMKKERNKDIQKDLMDIDEIKELKKMLYPQMKQVNTKQKNSIFELFDKWKSLLGR